MTPTAKILIAGDPKVGKTRLLLAHTEGLPAGSTALLLDYHRGATWYLASRREDARPGGPWFARPVPGPSLYELAFLTAVLKDPPKATAEIKIAGQPLDAKRLSPPIVRVAKEIHDGSVVVTAVLIDTLTELGDQTVVRVFGEQLRTLGETTVEKLTDYTWMKVNDDIAVALDTLLALGIDVLGTAWLGPDRTAAVLRPVRAMVDLEIRLEPHPRSTPRRRLPARARVVGSRLPSLPTDALVEGTWGAIRDPRPTFLDLPPEDEEITAQNTKEKTA